MLKPVFQKAVLLKLLLKEHLKRITLTIHTARPGVVIGKGGNEVDKIKEELKKLTNKDVQINIFEIKRPELDAKLVGESIAQQIEARISYKRAMKQAIASAMRVGAEGIKIKVSGRLAGADMARTEQYKEGSIPLHTLRADIDYAISEAQTVYGKIGIKVWIFKGEIYGKRDLSPNVGVVSNAQQGRWLSTKAVAMSVVVTEAAVEEVVTTEEVAVVVTDVVVEAAEIAVVVEITVVKETIINFESIKNR